MDNRTFPDVANLHPVALWLSVTLVIAIAGARFVDGTMLLAIAGGGTIEHPVFKVQGAQYVWDSPLKIALLRALPPRVPIIIGVFGALGILPLVGLLFRNSRFFSLTIVAVFLTPALKISVQNMGTGDGLVIALTVAMSAFGSYWLVAASVLGIGLWHPQQAFFIGCSYLVANYCYGFGWDRKRVFAIIGPLCLAGAAYVLYRASLGFSFAGRATYMADKVSSFIGRNAAYAPMAFAPIGTWLLFAPVRPKGGWGLMASWMGALVTISLLTTDVTRVMTLISLPIVLVGANRIIADGTRVSDRRWILGGIAIMAIPPFSWSGPDYWLWPKLLRDACKYGYYCR